MITENNNVVVTEEHDCCEHLEVGDTADTVFYSNNLEQFEDGPRACCKECAIELRLAIAREEEEQDAEMTSCLDCGNEFPYGLMVHWRPYDMTSDEEPYHICKTCAVAEKHKQRKKKDNEDFEEEFGDI